MSELEGLISKFVNLGYKEIVDEIRENRLILPMANYFAHNYKNKALKDFCSLIVSNKSIEGFEKEKNKLVNTALNNALSSPLFLKDLYTEITTLQLPESVNPSNPLGYNASYHNSIRQMEFLGEILSKFSFRLKGEDKYVIGINENGKVEDKLIHPGNTSEKLKSWAWIFYHAPYFMSLDAEDITKLVEDKEEWSLDTAKDTPKFSNPKETAIQFLNFAYRNKAYASLKPHEILLPNSKFKSITLLDCFDKGVLFKVKGKDSDICIGSILNNQGNYIFSASNLFPGNLQNIEEENEWANNSLVLLGAMTRDLFIYEEMTKFYSMQEIGGIKKQNKQSRQNKIVWLPRFRINYQPFKTKEDLEKIVDYVSPIEVAASKVDGHTRKCKNPSEKQLILAEKYGVQISEGFTFVRPHDRGSYTKADIKYKSRSALKVLLSAEE